MWISFAQNPFSYKRPLKPTKVNHSSKYFIDKILMIIDTIEKYISASSSLQVLLAFSMPKKSPEKTSYNNILFGVFNKLI